MSKVSYYEIAKNTDLTVREVRQYASCFLESKDETSVEEDLLPELLDAIARWKKGKHAVKYLNTTRQRFHILMKDYGINPRVFGEKTMYYSVVDLDFVIQNKKGIGRPIGSVKK